MLKTILFDLDDTLLGNNMEQFIPRYFSLLGEYAQPLFADRRQLLQELMAGTQAMIINTDPALTNRDVFWKQFVERTGLDVEEAEPFFNRFYDEQFAQLQPVTEARPQAVALVEYCFEQGLQVVVATNPLFPRRAIEHRLGWAGLSPAEFEFALVTSYENMHAAKPQLAYYREILEQVNAVPEESLMVGDDWNNDIVPATKLGMRAFWIAPADADWPDEKAEQSRLIGRGSLDDFFHWLRANSDEIPQ